MTRPTLLRLLAPLAVLIASFALYLSTLAPGMLRGDSGEFQWAMATLNVAHATGYPLFTLLGHAWLQLGLTAPVAWQLNLLSALFGAASVAMVFILARAVTGRTWAAIVGAVFFALAPVFWFNASILEVYTLNTFFLALLLYLLWRWANPGSPVAAIGGSGSSSLYVAFLVLGLALAHHRLTVLALPGILVYVLLVDRRLLTDASRLLALAVMLLPGLLLYLYVPLRLTAAGYDLHYAVFDIILGQEYAGSFLREVHWLPVLWQIPTANFHVGLALAALGVYELSRRQRNFSVLLLLVVAVDVLFAIVYTVPDVPVFVTPTFVVLAVWIAAGAANLLDWIAARAGPDLRQAAVLAAGLIVLAAPLAGLLHYPEIVQQVAQERGDKESRARSLLAANLPAGALLELDWETATAVRFLQATENLRPDLEARLIKLNARDEYLWVLTNLDAGRPVYVERGVKWTRALSGYAVEDGPVDLARLVPAAVPDFKLAGVIDDKVSLVGQSFGDTKLVLYWRASQPLVRDLATFVHYFGDDGRPLGQEDHAPCCQALFAYRTTEWPAGSILADTFRPAPAGANYLQVGMYSLQGDDIQPYGQTLYFQLAPATPPVTARPLGIRLGDGVNLRAYDLVKQADRIILDLYWESVAGVEGDWSVFVHSLDQSGKLVEQADRQPLDGVYPTHAWQPGQVVRDRYVLPPAREARRLELGMYDPPTGKRLVRADGQGDTILIDIP